MCVCVNVCVSVQPVRATGAAPAWGRYVTQMQMVQFVLMNAQGVYLLWQGCPYPAGLLYTYFAYVLSLLALFAQFYLQKHGAAPSRPKSS